MNIHKGIIDKITMLFIRISSLMMMFLVLMMVVNILGRKLFNSPISGTVELIEYVMLACIALAVSRTGFEDRQLTVTLLQEYLPAKPRAIIKCFCQLAAAAIFGILIVKFAAMIPTSAASGRVSDVLYIPYYLVYVLLTVAMVMVAMTFIYQAVLAIKNAFFKTTDEKLQEGDGK